MTIEWKTKNINIQVYYKTIRRCIILNGDDGTPLSGQRAWARFKERWTIIVAPLEEADKYKDMYAHLKIEGSGAMAWGITGKDVLWWFVTDSNNPFIFRENIPPGFHEMLHALYQQEVGTAHVTRQYDVPDGKRGTKGPAATVIVHDVWYGSKIRIKMWFMHSMWVPTSMPYMPIKTATEIYELK